MSTAPCEQQPLPAPAQRPLPPPAQPQGPYWGKYRGTVTDNRDPMVSARLQCNVPSLPGGVLNWATPCVPYAALGEGLLSVPPVGANVWIEFEGGNLDYPVWTGCFWENGQIPVMPELSPEKPDAIKVFRSKSCTLIYNDLRGEGGITLSVADPAVDAPVTMTFNSEGMAVNVGELSLVMDPESGITLQAGETVVSLNSETGVSIEAPTVKVNGATTIEPEATVTGDLNVSGATTAEGDVDVGGVLSVEGESNFTGAVTVEGEANFAGAVTAEGDVAVAGAVEVVGPVTTGTLFIGLPL